LENSNLIPFFGIRRQYALHREELLTATDEVYRSGQVLDGMYTQRFEQAIARRCDRAYAVAVNSGTQGLKFALEQFEDSEQGLIIPAISFVATINMAVQSAFKNIHMVDVDPQGLMYLESLERAHIEDRIGTVMYVNLYGNTIDYDRFRLQTEFFTANQLNVIEDAAQSFGASYKGIPSGKMGDISVLSFDPTKNLPNYGSGGMVLTDDASIASNILNERNNGKESDHEYSGTNSKMSESDCAQMLVKLQYFDTWQERRTRIAEYYSTELLKFVDVPMATPGAVHAWHKYVIRAKERSKLQHHLMISGIETKVHYNRTLYDYPVGSGYGPDPVVGSFWEATRLTRECLSLPIYPELTDDEVERVAEAVRDFYW
jgi:dTDP-4-amino-4,6-dideoxygalactose transaminase